MLLLFTHPNTYNKWQHKNSTLTAFRFLHFSLSTSTSTSTLIHYIYIYYYYYLLLLLTNHLKFFIYIFIFLSFFLSNLFIFIFFNISLINSTSTYLLIFYKSFDYIHHHPITSFYSQKFFSLLRNFFLYKFGDQKKFINNFLQPIHPYNQYIY